MGLKLLGVGTGRDGTFSLCKLLESVYRTNDAHLPAVHHESDNRSLYNHLCQSLSDQRDAPIRAILQDWDHDIEVGNGFQFYLPLIHEIFGSELKIIRLRRNREACIQSLARRPLINPQNWGGYLNEMPETRSEILDFVCYRPTAVSCGELSEKEWKNFSLIDKLGWYYDKSHALLDEHLNLFREVLEVKTEDLSSSRVLDQIVRFVDPNFDKRPQAVHVHQAINMDYSEMSQIERQRLELFFAKLDMRQAARSELYPIQHFLNTILSSVGQSKEADQQIYLLLKALRTHLDQNIQYLEQQMSS